ncbi:hypothetical protein [Aeromicrobium sp.]|uniref:hypothetical protein n=1 Tax=Aeromicrobium sp. TaxID=1871063 RepID=UPI002FCB49D4
MELPGPYSLFYEISQLSDPVSKMVADKTLDRGRLRNVFHESQPSCLNVKVLRADEKSDLRGGIIEFLQPFVLNRTDAAQATIHNHQH